MRSGLLLSLVTVCALVARPQTAAADPIHAAEDELPSGAAFRYHLTPDGPVKRQYVRAILEEISILGLGELQYLSNTANAVDWDLAYDWPSFQSKLTFRSYAFDTNLFATNWATHPVAGFFYYSAARSNRLSITESFLFAVAGSTLWEYLGEYREQVAINDQIVTPVGGSVFGEAMMQLGALFQRSRRTPTTTALAWLFGAPKLAHDTLDGATVVRTDDVDALGFPADEFHRFRVIASAGVTKQDRGLTQSDGRVSASSRVVALKGYERPGRGSTLFDSGEVSDIYLGATMSSGNLVDFLVAAEVVAAGVYWKDLRGGPGALSGQSMLGGMQVGFEYGNHDYYRGGNRRPDQAAMVNVGATVEHAWHAGGFALRTHLDAMADFAGISAFALQDYLRQQPIENLNTIVREQGYYHAAGATLWPRVELELGRFDAGGDVRVDLLGAINELDRRAEDGAELADARDRRIQMRGWLGVSPAPWLRLTVSGERRYRKGRIGEVTASRGETSLFGNVELRF